MDRINGADTIDIGQGRRGFRDENVQAGTPGSEVTAAWLNGLQEEVLKVITEAALNPDPNDWTQLFQAIGVMITTAIDNLTDTDTFLTEENVQDIVGAFIAATGASIVYDDAGNALQINVEHASEIVRGIIQVASDADRIAGIDNTRALTSKHLKDALDSFTSIPGTTEIGSHIYARVQPWTQVELAPGDLIAGSQLGYQSGEGAYANWNVGVGTWRAQSSSYLRVVGSAAHSVPAVFVRVA